MANMAKKSIHAPFTHLFLILFLTVGCLGVSTASAETESPGEETVRFIKLHLSDQDDRPLAQLVIMEGEMGSVYFEDTDGKAIGLLPRTDDEGKVEIAVYQVEKDADDNETAEFFRILPPMVTGASTGVEMAAVGDFNVRVVGMKTAKLPADAPN